MTLFIDPPRWPAHGTVFSHLVSDTSVAELHAFVAALGISPRAFDLDHYDVPAHRHADAVGAGAVPVDGKELVKILVASGMRVPARRRPKRLASTLRQRWNSTFPAMPWLGEELVERWSEPHRSYHDLGHLLRVLESIDALVAAREHPELVAAAWFHDAVHQGRAGTDERQSADLARNRLKMAGYSRSACDRVARLVLATLDHTPDADDADAQVLVDADLSILGTDDATYQEYAREVRDEYRHVPDRDFAPARVEILSRLLDKPALFHTERGSVLWEERARINVRREISALKALART
ncbi:DUF4031 domain-containing protein [Kocuria sp. cx-116]|uniref:DUF4031 domain-containing protein n=1 Tax=Kocuria sp. cx-116 TaxID=2771378 RepID=UPI00168608F1|nr:DUF4031 domain-containing protein [Kocuria sp. cx-116]MBD2762831.1 DUF4031 domain-containing protein [Kocuria sp. cx-116]